MKGDEMIELLPEAIRIGASDYYLQPNPVEDGLDLLHNRYRKGKYTVHFVGFFWSVLNLKKMVEWYGKNLPSYNHLQEGEIPELIKAMKSRGFKEGLEELE